MSSAHIHIWCIHFRLFTPPLLSLLSLPSPRLSPQNSQDTLRLGVGSVGVSGYILALIILAIYVPGAPYMYMNMVGNRRAAFRKRNAAAAEASKKSA